MHAIALNFEIAQKYQTGPIEEVADLGVSTLPLGEASIHDQCHPKKAHFLGLSSNWNFSAILE